MTLWLPWAKLNKASVDGGAWAGGYAKKLVVHTTEADAFHPGTSYYGHNSWPHWTNERDGTLWQHMDADAPARALKNTPGGVETNKGGAWQVENCGFSANGNAALTLAQVATLRRLVAELRDRRGLLMVALPAGAIPGSASSRAPQRMTAAEWRAFGGICGHRHVPENDHWDPGAFDLRRLLVADPAPAPPEEDEVTDEDIAKIAAKVAEAMSPAFELRDRVWWAPTLAAVQQSADPAKTARNAAALMDDMGNP